MASGSLTGGGINIEFDSEFPTGLNFSKTADWVPVAPISRWAPVQGYASSGPATVTFNIRFALEGGGKGGSGGGGKGVMDRVKDVRRLVCPQGYRPPKVTLKIEGWVKLEGVVNSVSDTVPEDAAWVGNEPTVVDVSITVIECSQKDQAPFA